MPTVQLTDTLNFKSQITTEQLNKHMLGLTRETVDDSATVRVIGVVTLIYLPSTFVAVRRILHVYILISYKLITENSNYRLSSE